MTHVVKLSQKLHNHTATWNLLAELWSKSLFILLKKNWKDLTDLLDLLLKTQKQSKEHLEIQIRLSKPIK